MYISSSIAYRRFLNDYFCEFRIKHFNDIIDFLEQDEDHIFVNFLVENEISHEVETKFSFAVNAIANELGLNSLDLTNSEKESCEEYKVYDDVVKMIKVKLKNDILDSSAYYHLAQRIN